MSIKKQKSAACLVSLFLISTPISADTHTLPPAPLDWQEKMLFYPPPSQLSAEQQGRITIYDSLDYGLVNEALDQHFDRIQNMMFIRIHHLPPAGAGPADVEKDGCD